MTTARVRPEFVPLEDGTVLVVGGENANTATAELFDPSENRFSALGPTVFAHYPTSTSSVLPDGSVLLVGGRDGDAAELYLPETREFVGLTSPSAARRSHAATVLDDGRVALTGGVKNSGDLAASHGEVEYYNPTTRLFESGPPLPSPRSSHAAVMLADGDVLIAGGSVVTGFVGQPLRTAVLLNPPSGLYTALPDTEGAYTQAVRLDDGRVLLGGPFHTARAEVFDGSGFSSPVTMRARHVSGTLTLLPDGHVLAAGGWREDFTPGITDIVEMFDPVTNEFTEVASLSAPRNNHGVAVLRDGRVLVAGGAGTNATSEIFAPPLCYGG